MAEEKSWAIVAPEGYEIDKEKSTIEKIVFKKKELELSNYNDIAKSLFYKKSYYYPNSCGHIFNKDEMYCNGSVCWDNANNAPTREQWEWLLALNKLKNTAIVLNGSWKPDWKDYLADNYVLAYNHLTNSIEINWNMTIQHSLVYFKTKELALKAIELLGEETIKTALGVYLS